MPLYEYICQECGTEFEEIQKFSDPNITECPACHQHSVVKKISLTAFQLKGEGWYKDGYSRKSEQSKKEETKAEKAPDKKEKGEKKEKKEAISQSPEKTTPAKTEKSSKVSS